MKMLMTLSFLLLVSMFTGCGSVLAPAERETAEQEIERVQQEEQAHFQNAK